MKKNTNQQTKQNNNKGLLTTIKTAKNKTRKRDKKKRGKKSNSTELSTSTCNSAGYPTKVARIKGHLLSTINCPTGA